MTPRDDATETPRDDATERQVQAARPDVSTWLSANAGSGKTRVLTDRVARLLLNGTEPQNILCLTYTKAAASEMQNRLFRRLGAWAMMSDDDLAGQLQDLGADGATDATALRAARTLFARAIETPGGLKIQTIHSFCAALLRRFPLEAGVSPQFTEMEDRAAALLRAEIVEDFADGPRAGLIDGLARHLSDMDFDRIAGAVAARRAAFDARPMGEADLQALFGLPAGYDDTALLSDVFLGGETGLLATILPVLRDSGGNNAKAAEKLAGLVVPSVDALTAFEGAFLTGASAREPFTAKISSFPTKALREGALAAQMPALESLMGRVETARQRRLALAAARKSAALHAFAADFLPEYARRKQRRGLLDFDDLILGARRLLSDPAVAAWVLYRLDGGIDHILVDEAQDTSPAQWQVIERLAQEFASGEGTRDADARTIFVVGDRKQSIYSFQGADPAEFDRMQAEFGQRLGDAGKPLESLTLEYSFRSAGAILRLVDLVFEGCDSAGFGADGLHRAFKSDLPGRVDLWPVVPKSDDGDDGHWADPVDRRSEHHHDVVLANRIARAIANMIGTETIPVDGAGPGQFRRRKVRAGDFLILVQRRSDLFAEIIRACKAGGLPIAGADRLKVGAELAVKDLAALLRFLATPEDSLSLAEALKSPLFGWSEQALFDLAHRRETRFLWRALRDREAEFAAEIAMLRDLRDAVDFLRPYDLIERILTRHDGRRKLLARLGPEAEDGINALLGQALAYERTEIPGLTGFLTWMETDDLEIKRQVDSGGDLIRVMTVHGAKGLEAPIVILPDTAPRRKPPGAGIVMTGDTPLWRVAQAEMPALMAEADAGVQARQEQERLRLLYVAMTRAEKWLIVAAAGDFKEDAECWFTMIRDAMTQAGAEAVPFEGGDGLRLAEGDWSGLPVTAETADVPPEPVLPECLTRPAPAPVMAVPTLTPSDLGGEKALPGGDGLDEDAAMRRGTALHMLLEHLPGLPAGDRARRAAVLLPDWPDPERAALLAEAAGVLDAPDLAGLFAADALAEVAVSAPVGAARVHGQIDRLLVSPERVLAVDFKTNATVPARAEACPEGLLRQMGAYAAALAQVWPDRVVDTAILWTRTAHLMPLPHDLVSAALSRASRLDDGGGGT
ncbi:double-strand break repair helicase AddA [Pukyongiella litopenaei]|uniref:DNA 3'-5' helicase n=1 Tax=Pukyongiella litopenaei TaxID=2605946 RepID=A0A2S0MSC9_9RHOB|nr:double-strand break repair helicase AddA [Pukyongiella litopenaei]AVO38772.1 double-strand break repair helicase AddA [Pukyongiella litopenaei]